MEILVERREKFLTAWYVVFEKVCTRENSSTTNIEYSHMVQTRIFVEIIITVYRNYSNKRHPQVNAANYLDIAAFIRSIYL